MVSELTEINPLPCTQIQAVIGNGDGQFCSNQGTLYVSRHIICSFINMRIEGVIFRHQMVHKGLEVIAHRSVGILIQSQTGRCMLDLNMHDSGIGQFACYFLHTPGDQMKPPGMVRQQKSMLSGHGCSLC